jgi:hypothetical protein
VRCVATRWAFTFKTSFEPREKDLKDVLSLRFGFEVPPPHRRVVRKNDEQPAPAVLVLTELRRAAE